MLEPCASSVEFSEAIFVLLSEQSATYGSIAFGRSVKMMVHSVPLTTDVEDYWFQNSLTLAGLTTFPDLSSTAKFAGRFVLLLPEDWCSSLAHDCLLLPHI